MQTFTAIFATVLAAGSFSASISADELPQGVTQQRHVEMSDLDLSRAIDAETLFQRIRAAAKSACRADTARWDVKRVYHARLCVESAVESAIARVNAPLLTARHRHELEQLAGL